MNLSSMLSASSILQAWRLADSTRSPWKLGRDFYINGGGFLINNSIPFSFREAQIHSAAAKPAGLSTLSTFVNAKHFSLFSIDFSRTFHRRFAVISVHCFASNSPRPSGDFFYDFSLLSAPQHMCYKMFKTKKQLEQYFNMNTSSSPVGALGNRICFSIERFNHIEKWTICSVIHVDYKLQNGLKDY